MTYRVTLPDFHGPLDLLLHLVKRHELDVRDLPIAEVATQFQHYLDAMHGIDLELAGDFLVVAATLMEIKSRLLLPRPEAAEAEEADDPRHELVKQLLEYKKFKDASARLAERAADHGRRLSRADASPPPPPGGPPPVQALELWDLVSAFGRLMSETQSLQTVNVLQDDTPQSVYQEEVQARLAGTERLPFRDLFAPPFARLRLVGLFLAVLDLARRGDLAIGEEAGEIWLALAGPIPA